MKLSLTEHIINWIVIGIIIFIVAYLAPPYTEPGCAQPTQIFIQTNIAKVKHL